MVFEFLKRLFGKAEEPEQYPQQFCEIAMNPIARSQGVKDDYNKNIFWYLKGELIRVLPYSKELADAIRETYEIPVRERIYDEEEEFEFDTVAEFGVTRLKR